ncbi:MAG: glycosyltransferase [Segetibacter sp.]
MQIRISVIVPTYKRPQLLKNCLLNLCNQTFDSKEYEIIIVSDGPDKETEMLVSEFANCQFKNIRFLCLPVKKGPAAARNAGWQSAQGILIAFTDDDCLPEKTWLENIWKHYDYEAEIAFTGKVIVPVSQQPTDFELNTKGLETGDFVTANCICTKATLKVIGGFDEAFTAAWREDSDLEFKLLKHKVPIIKLHDAVVIHSCKKSTMGHKYKRAKENYVQCASL